MKKHALRRLALCLTLCALPTVFGCGQKGPLVPAPQAYNSQ